MQGILRVCMRLAHVVVASGIALFLLFNVYAPVRSAGSHPVLEFVETTPLSLTTATTSLRQIIFVRNTDSAPVKVRFSTKVHDGEGKMQQLDVGVSSASGSLMINGLQIEPFILEFRAPTTSALYYAEGYLVVTPDNAPDAMPDIRELTVTVPSAPPFKGILSIPLFISAVIVICAMLRTRHNKKSIFSRMLGAATWDFTTSWTSTTAVGTVFLNATLLALIPQDSSANIGILTAVFGIFVLVAPFFYNASVEEVLVGTDIQPKGWVICYFLACLFTLWGVFGGLYVGYILIDDIPWPIVIDDLLIGFLPWVAGLVVGAVAIYAFRKMALTVKNQVNATTPDPLAQSLADTIQAAITATQTASEAGQALLVAVERVAQQTQMAAEASETAQANLGDHMRSSLPDQLEMVAKTKAAAETAKVVKRQASTLTDAVQQMEMEINKAQVPNQPPQLGLQKQQHGRFSLL